MKIKLAEANRFQAEATKENRLSYLFVTFTFIILFLSLGALLMGIRRYFYKPIISLRKMIDNFQLQNTSIEIPLNSATEIKGIAHSFQQFSTAYLSRKKVS